MTKRRCIGCGEIKDSKNMFKVTKNFKNNEILINPDKFHFGRSIYICKSENCINTAFKKERIAKNLKKNITNEEKENIKTVLNTMVVVQH